MPLPTALIAAFREFNRYTGDGLPGEPANAPLPVGDPQSGPHNPKKSAIRAGLQGLLDAIQGMLNDAEVGIPADESITRPKLAGMLSKSIATGAHEYGVTGDGATNDAATFAAIASGTNVVLTPGVYFINTTVTIAANLEFMQGARLKLGVGVTLTINGRVVAPDDLPIFEYAPTSHLYLGTVNRRVPVGWFFANIDGTTDIAFFLNDQMHLWPSDGREFSLPNGKRRLTSTWDLRDRNFVSIRGTGGNLRSNVDSNVDPKWPGGGSALVMAEGLAVAIKVPESGIPGKRVSGLVIDGISIIGNNNKTVDQTGILIDNDNDGVIIRNTVIISCRDYGILAFGADAMLITGNWVSECKRAIKVEGSIELRISNNNLGGQPDGATIDLVDAGRFLLTENNIYPDGHISLNIFNCRQGVIANNHLHSRFVGMITINGSNNLNFSGNTLRCPWGVETVWTAGKEQWAGTNHDPIGRDIYWGIVRIITSDDNLWEGNLVHSRLPTDGSVLVVASGARNEIVGGKITGNPSIRKVVNEGGATGTIINRACLNGEAGLGGGYTVNYKGT